MMNAISAFKVLLMPEEKIRYTLPISKGDNVLIISPHPDDETLGCGGAIIKMLSLSVNITVVLLTDGNGGGRVKDISWIRKKEFMKSRSVLGYSTFDILNYPDGQLVSYKEKLSEQIRSILFEVSPKLVLTPYLLDCSIDHQITNVALVYAINSLSQFNMVVGMYEIWTPMVNPNCYLNISDEYSRKRMAMECYQSQEEYFGIIDKAETLNIFRAKTSMRRSVKYMECFKILDSKKYVDMVESWKTIQRYEKESEIEYDAY